jgi:hypothetical protein
MVVRLRCLARLEPPVLPSATNYFALRSYVKCGCAITVLELHFPRKRPDASLRKMLRMGGAMPAATSNDDPVARPPALSPPAVLVTNG